jgi:hypothetical protein
VVVSDKVFDTGTECGPAITFALGGTGLMVRGNMFKGQGRKIIVDPRCKDVVIRDNLGSQ